MQDLDVFFLSNDNKTLSGVSELDCPAEIHVPQGVTKIDRRAFADCPAKIVILPDSVTEIAFEAFAGCDALEYVHLPKKLDSIGSAVFRGCLSLTKIDMPDSIPAFSESLFECCVSLKDIPFRDGVLELPRNVFSECSSIESLVIPKSVALIRSGAAGYCENLSTIVLPAGIKLIEDDAFRGCSALAHIRFADDNPVFFTDDAGVLFGRRDDGNLTLIKVPVSAREITIPGTVVQSHSEAFTGCDALEKIYIDCELIDHPIFVALKTEVVNAEIINTSAQSSPTGVSCEPVHGENLSSETADSCEPVPVEEEEPVSVEETLSEPVPSGDDLLTDILGQNADCGDDEAVDELEGIRITPEELDEAVMRGIQEESEAKQAARLADVQNHKDDGANTAEDADSAGSPVEILEPRFVYGMESMSAAFEIMDERSLYPDRPEQELDTHQPVEMEDITTLVVVTEKVNDDRNISPVLKDWCASLARQHEIKRIYFFGGLGLDNDEFLFGFGKFALYRNVVYAAASDNLDGLSKVIRNFAEIAELASPVSPFQKVSEPNSLELEKPFKIFVQDCGGENEMPSAESVSAEESVEEKPPVSEPVSVKEEVSAVGLLARAQRLLNRR